MIEDIQVQTSEGKEIHLEKLGGILSSTPLFVVEFSFQAIQMTLVDLDQNPSPKEEYDMYNSCVWDVDTTNSHGLFDKTFSSTEYIMEVMNT